MDADRKWVIVRIDGKIAAISTDYRLLASISAGLSAGSHIYKGRNKGGRTRQKTEGVSLYREITAVSVGFEEVWKLRQELKWEDMILYGTDFQKAVWRKLWELTHHRMDGDEMNGAKGVGEETAKRYGGEIAEEIERETAEEGQDQQAVDGDEVHGAKGVGEGTAERFGGEITEEIERETAEEGQDQQATDGDDMNGAEGVGGKIAEEQPEARLISYSDFAGLCSNRAGVRAVAHAIGLNPVSIVIPCHLVIPKESIDKITDIQKKAESTIFKGDDLCLNSILNDSSIDFGEYSHGRELKRMLIRKELTGF
ncbi:MAG: MGMT family protein [Bacteroidales bacterium]|nr:MGMT family protein [Bacteroidales bacterium]